MASHTSVMIWRPRAARASMTCLCLRDNMTPQCTFRLFIVLMIIATTVIESPVSAVSISRRPRHTQISKEGLAAEESTVTEIRNESTTATTVADAVKEITSQTSAKVYEIKGDPNVEDKVELTTAFILLKTDDGYLKITGLPIYTSSIKGTETLSSDITTNLPGSTNSLQDKASGIEELTTAMNSDFTSTATHTTKTRSNEQTTHESPLEITIEATALDKNTKLEQSTLSEIKSSEPINVTTVETFDTTLQSDIATNNEQTSEGTSGTSSASTISNIDSHTDQSEQNTFTPSWKKYTTIDRKNIVSQMSMSSSEKNLQTTPTRISLEKLLTDTSISSLGQLRESLNTKTTYALDVSSTSPFVLEKETISVAPDVSSTSSTTTSKGTSPRTLQITSKRAGFLDYSAKPAAEEATTIIENYDIPDKFNESRGFSSMFEFESDDPVSEGKNKTDVASQSQLAEDVMREEMMKEEMISNEKENANRYREVDQFSVRPIEKTSIYSVGNYKPMKKLDVQPSKPFIRDPDDLSWRNESISSLGIVFKAKPAAKNFTEVLKNKTETLINNANDKDSKNDLPDLRERLEKIAEVRKSKKKKVIDKLGETIYSDYEENSNSAETTSASTTTTSSTTLATEKALETVVTKPEETDLTTQVSVKHVYPSSTYPEITEPRTTKAPKKLSLGDYYDNADDYDSDYLNFPNIELKKFTTRLTSKNTPPTTITVATTPFQQPSTFHWPDRKPTLQYFPPRPTTQKFNGQPSDENPVNKLNYYTFKETTKNLIPVAVRYTTLPAPPELVSGHQKDIQTAAPLNKYKNDLTKTVYYTQPKVVAVTAGNGYDGDGNYNRPTYVIKHFKDLIEKASKENDDEKDKNYEVGYTATQNPKSDTTVSDLIKNTRKINLDDDYDYDAGFRRDVINRFVDNFNQNSERFKVDFPILYNNSVVHRKEEDGGHWATSSAFMKRLYEDMSGRRGRECAGCERRVELPPEYELHYYVPDQEEQEEAESRSPALYKYTWHPHAQR